jgi:hypothetical protein
MSTSFEEALKTSVLGVDQGFRDAVTDLRQEVSAASAAVSKLTNQQASLELRKNDEQPLGTYFDMRMNFSPVNSNSRRYYDVSAFFISAKGYPIKAGCSVSVLAGGEYEIEIPDVSQLKKYFVDMASNPDSSLVLRLALLLRAPN